ncbi:MAG: ribbon-helix-helix protein, CopG family [Thermoplasmata archaeon]|nr:MAG: ribbon-helix-helix protein, CopG family [Thermoplasmata archaeon]
MVQKTQRVSARVPEELVRRLEGIMDKEGITSISEGLRECIEEYIRLKQIHLSTENIIIDIGEDILSDVDNLVDIGRISGREEAFHHAIKSWTESQVEKYIVGREKYSKTITQTKSKILETREQKKLNSYYKMP